MPKDLRSFMAGLQKMSPPGLLHVKREVSRDLELTAVLRRLQEDGQYPAVLFENVAESDLPVIANVLANPDNLALALDTTPDQMLWAYIGREDQRIP